MSGVDDAAVGVPRCRRRGTSGYGRDDHPLASILTPLIPLYLVILKGDFNGHHLFVVPTDGLELRGTYVAYVFDLAHGAPGDVTFTILSEDGAAFKQALGDPQLPDADTIIPDPQPPYPPCQDVVDDIAKP